MGSVPAARPRRIDHHPHRARDVGGDGVPEKPDRHRDVGVDAAAPLGWPVHARARLSGQRACPATVRDGVARAGAVDARHGRCDPGGVAVAGKRRTAAVRERALRPQLDGAARSIPVRSSTPTSPSTSRRSAPTCAPSPARLPTGSPPPDLHDPLHRRAHQAGGRAGCGRGRTGSVGDRVLHEAPRRHRGRRRLARPCEARSSGSASRSTCRLRRTGACSTFTEWGEHADRAATLSKAHRWDELSALVDDEMLPQSRRSERTPRSPINSASGTARESTGSSSRSLSSGTGDGDTLRHLLAAIRAD